MTLQKSRDSFNVKGGGLLKTAVLASGGSFAVMDDVGYLDQTDIKFDPGMVQWEDERGFVINALPGTENWTLTTNLMQSSINEISLIQGGWSAYRHFYYYVKLANGNFQEMYLPLCKIISPLEVQYKAPNKRILKLEIQVLMPKGLVTVTPAGLSVPDSTYGVIVENSAALGQVTTTSGTIYTAAV